MASPLDPNPFVQAAQTQNRMFIDFLIANPSLLQNEFIQKLVRFGEKLEVNVNGEKGVDAFCANADTFFNASPFVTTPCSWTASMAASNSSCMPTQMPSTGRPSRTRSTTTGPASSASIPAMQAAYAPTPGTTRPSHPRAAARSAVTVTSAPTRASARCAERRLPDP